ncbi:MAG: glycosyltransferase family 4 protein [Gemmiger sp.]|nr:glycosyltransferase family 4 protein [Gemmiger sp.]
MDGTEDNGGAGRRILLVHDRYRLPGGEDAVFEAERALLERHGWEVSVYCRDNAEVDGHPLRKALLPFTALFSLRTLREVGALLRTIRPAVVHVHNTLLVVSPAVFWACRWAGVPVVQTLHNFRLFCPNGILLRDGKICEDCPAHGLSCAVRHRCYRGSAAQSLVCAGVYALHRCLGTYRHVALIALTEFDRQKLLAFNRATRRPVFDPARLFVKPHFVALPPAFLNTPPLPWQARKNQVVYAARLEELKGLPTALAAWAQLAPAGSPTLLVAGTGPLEEWAKATVRDKKLAVKFLGQLSKPALLALLAESRAALVPSLCYESFALVPAEAHALGTPVLGSDLGNVGAAVAEGVDGLRFAPGDPTALAAAVSELCQLGEAEAWNPAAIQAAALARYAPEENYRQLCEIYAQVEKEGQP